MSPYIYAGLKNKSAFLRNRQDKKNDILLIVANYVGVSPHSIKSKIRLGTIAYARHLFCLMCTHHTKDKQMAIGGFINRHRTTVIHSLRSIGNLQATEEKVRNDIKEVSDLVDKLV